MKDINSPLKYIMDLLKISGKELADYIFVDRTLVSKWKNNARTFSPSVSYFENVVEYLLLVNKRQKANTLERFFERIYPYKENKNCEWLSSCLCTWLIGNDIGQYKEQLNRDVNKDYLYSASVDIYRGNIGKRNAVNSFFDYALSLDSEVEIFLSDMEDMSWLIENKQFFKIWQKKMGMILEKGHHITIIHNTGRNIESIFSIIFNWLPLYFKGNLSSYYHQNTNLNILTPSVYIIKNHLAIMSMNAGSNNKDRYTSVFKDPESVNQMEWIFENRLNFSTPLVELYEFSHRSIEKLTNTIIKLGQKKEQAYLFTPVPVFTTMSNNTLSEVLHDNNISGDLKKQCLAVHDGIQKFYLKDITKYFCRQFYDLDILYQMSDMDEFPYLELSEFALKPIIISNKQFKQHIMFLINLIKKYELFEVALLPLKKLKVPSNISIWVKSNCFVYSYPQFHGKSLTLSSESMTINAFFRKLEKTWENVPLINKDKDWVIKQLSKIIKD